MDIDFSVSGLPHSAVKQAENSRVRELMKKIGNHPHRQALQEDLQQNNAYNPFSAKSKKMIQDMGNFGSTLTRHRPIQGESHLDFLGESEGPLPQPHDSFPE